MPGRNTQKLYVKNGYYHLYNRGVDKRTIFEDQQDIGVFLSYLKEYLLPKDEVKLRLCLANPSTLIKEKDSILKMLRLNNFYNSISLLSYCLMPNHFHLLVKQYKEDAIDVFMNSLGTRYTMYFNRKHKRVGPLYQGVYRAVLIETDEQLLHLSRYIHRNPLDLQGVALQTLSEQYSSYAEYIGHRKTYWENSQEIISYYSTAKLDL
ncbi:transposase, partial [Candidatus Gottesmanbacteria bacterium]|nr:transposase [Candidatus Gottesmanbacteria bacterium]